MTEFDVYLGELASGIDSLSKRSLVALYWACSSALRPECLGELLDT
jgi:hypothetical protein